MKIEDLTLEAVMPLIRDKLSTGKKGGKKASRGAAAKKAPKSTTKSTSP
jgi:topoisomerase IA-like protein